MKKKSPKQKKLVFTGNPMELFLPPGTLDFFDIEGHEVLPSPDMFGETYVIKLIEKNIKPTVPEGHDADRLRFKGYSLKSLSDFPIRGRKSYLSIKRRKWQIEGVPGTIMRDITVEQKGVKLAKDFAFFFEGED